MRLMNKINQITKTKTDIINSLRNLNIEMPESNTIKLADLPQYINKISGTFNMSESVAHYAGETPDIYCFGDQTKLDNKFVNLNSNISKIIIGDQFISMNNMYNCCSNAFKNNCNIYISSERITSISKCFNGKSDSVIMNIYLPKESTTFNAFIKSNEQLFTNTSSNSILWEDKYLSDGYYHNALFNVYIYPVDDVISARILNND